MLAKELMGLSVSSTDSDMATQWHVLAAVESMSGDSIWLNHFVTYGGILYLLRLPSSWGRWCRWAVMELEGVFIQCCHHCLVANSAAFRAFLDIEGGVESLAIRLVSPNADVKLQCVQILSSLACVSAESYRSTMLTLEKLSTIQLSAKNWPRLWPIVDLLRNSEYTELQLGCMRLINAITWSPSNVIERDWARQELERLDITSIVAYLRRAAASNDGIQHMLDEQL